jgi:hypothetical protein
VRRKVYGRDGVDENDGKGMDEGDEEGEGD